MSELLLCPFCGGEAMSYRLINANALAANCKQVNDMPCIYADLPNGLDGGHYDMTQGNADKSQWHELFGTPERAARTFEDFCDKCDKGECNDCSLDRLTDFCIGYDALLEWLRGDAE